MYFNCSIILIQSLRILDILNGPEAQAKKDYKDVGLEYGNCKIQDISRIHMNLMVMVGNNNNTKILDILNDWSICRGIQQRQKKVAIPIVPH
jgi:hypothetical protein